MHLVTYSLPFSFLFLDPLAPFRFPLAAFRSLLAAFSSLFDPFDCRFVPLSSSRHWFGLVWRLPGAFWAQLGFKRLPKCRQSRPSETKQISKSLQTSPISRSPRIYFPETFLGSAVDSGFHLIGPPMVQIPQASIQLGPMVVQISFGGPRFIYTPRLVGRRIMYTLLMADRHHLVSSISHFPCSISCSFVKGGRPKAALVALPSAGPWRAAEGHSWPIQD